MKFTEEDIVRLAPDPAAVASGVAMAKKQKWLTLAATDQVIWGEIQGSAAVPYQTQVDIVSVAFKCTCPSRKFPCLHGLGLLLLYVKEAASFSNSTVPEWVQNWIAKRMAKLQAATEQPKVRTAEALEKLEKDRQKRADDRMELVENGVVELEQWLKDLVRAGLVQLPTKEPNYFDKMAARMVDAKAGGFANLVRALAQLDFVGSDHWKNEALELIAKTYLLIDAFRNIEAQSESIQLSIKNLVGWNLSPKELLESDSIPILDHWLAIGQETEEADDLIVQRNWFWGLETGQSALILNFATKFTPLESLFIPGAVTHAEFLFFNTAWKNRAVMKNCLDTGQLIPTPPTFLNSIQSLLEFQSEVLTTFPWANDIPVLLSNVCMVQTDTFFEVVDRNQNLLPIHRDTTIDQCLNWILLSDTPYQSVAGILRSQALLPLGIFVDEKYYLL